MTNSIDTYWEVDGVSLQTRAFNIETLEGRLTLPSFRGENEVIPHRPGERWLPKVPESRVLSLAMWIVGANADGSVPKARKEIFEDNLRALQRLFWSPTRQFALKKRFKINGAIRSATALGEYAGGLEPNMIGRYGAKVVVKIKLADPFFYDDVETTTNLATGNTSLTVLGDAITHNILVTINGARNVTKVRNNTMGIEFTHNAQLLVGARLEAAIREFRATTFPSGGAGQRTNASIVHAGAPQWLALQPGTNQIAISSQSGTGVVNLKHRGAWF